MDKIRVYELAKELGLENKAVLELCTRLGISGKRSHSSTLSADEAERVRRSVIRQALGVSESSERAIDMHGVSGTEKRMGNVVRRRRVDAPAEPAKTLDLHVERPQASESAISQPFDHVVEKRTRAEALARADALFSESEAEKTVQEEAAVEEVATAVEEEQAVLEAELEAAVKAAAAEQIEAEAETPGLSEEERAAESERRRAAALAEARRRHDVRAPKVLGRIELPAKKEEPEAEKKGSAPETPKAARGKRKVVEEEAVSDADKPKRLRRKKQVLKKDELLDYSSSERDTWRVKKDKKRKGEDGKDEAQERQAIGKKTVKIIGEISVGELAKQLSVKVGDVIARLLDLGVMATINKVIDYETASLVAGEFGADAVNTGHDEEGYLAGLRGEDAPESLVLRPPVVTVMGHVDHGKTSLLDAIRLSAVTEEEAGGITQAIGAYNVKLPSGGSVTFIDTPGHAAFTAMRSRGAKVTDIVVLVVAADDGVMPQTIEAINHAKAAEVPIIVAVNKMDKESANPDLVRNQLSEHGLISEQWGGTTIMVPVSAKTKQGLDLLLENLYVQAEILELKANPTRPAIGAVIESGLDRGRGPVMTVLVQNGTLRRGDAFLAGAVTGKVRALIAHDGNMLEEAGPGIPVEVFGASATPDGGDDFYVVPSEVDARRFAEDRLRRKRHQELAAKGGVLSGKPLSLESLSEMVKKGETRHLPLIIKADAQGSVEAVRQAVSQLGNEEVSLLVIHAGVGGVTENDIQLAHASNAVVVGFNVGFESRARETAETFSVDVKFFRIIYELVDAVDSALKGMLAPKYREKTLGRVEVRETFRVPKLGTVAGSYVLDGVVERGAQVRLLRDNKVVFEGKMASLRRFKDDVREVQSGYECGIGIDGYSDIKNGDIIEVFKMEEIRPN